MDGFESPEAAVHEVGDVIAAEFEDLEMVESVEDESVQRANTISAEIQQFHGIAFDEEVFGER